MVLLAVAGSTGRAAPPTITSAQTLGNPNGVTVAFSEAVGAPPAVSNFTVNNAISVTGVAPGAASNLLQLTTSPAFVPSNSYVLTIKGGVVDLAGEQIAANSQAPITFSVEVPAEFGLTVNGFQDDFSQDAALNVNWVPVGMDNFELTNGVLNITTMTGDPNKLLYEAPGYSNDVQEVLMRLRFSALANNGLNPRVGATVGADPTTGRGNNVLLVNGGSGPFAELLNDAIAWGPDVPGFAAQFDTWYWLRLSQTSTNAAGGDNLFAKAWLADGTEPEPVAWQVAWAQGGRAGFAGITGPSGGGVVNADVDYVMIEAAGLPSITMALSAFTLVPPGTVQITQQPTNATAAVGSPATFTVGATGQNVTYQWQEAPAGSTNFANIAGATSASYTTPAVTQTAAGSQYRCVLSALLAPNLATTAVASVLEDTVPPMLVSAQTLGNATQVTVVFSKPVALPAATNFSINNGIAVTGVSEATNLTTIQLAATALSATQSYTLTVNGVADLGGLLIEPNSQIAIDTSVSVPQEFGRTVNGFQDDFSRDTTLNANWVATDNDAFELTNGVLNITTMASDPNTLLYEALGYSNDVQEVLLRVRFHTLAASSANARVGATVGANAISGQGIAFLLANPPQTVAGWLGPGAELLNGGVVWGPTLASLTPQPETWYWLRLSQTSTNDLEANNIFAKAWLADGTEAEPPDWQLAWPQGGRAGFAGIAGPSNGGQTDADVDYILIEAAGLPSITMALSAFTLVPAGTVQITRQPTSATVAVGSPATFTVGATGQNITYQWQEAPAGSTNFANIAGATSASYTTPAVTQTALGSQYRCVLGALLAPNLATTAVASVLENTVPPTLVSAQTLGKATQVTVVFSKPVATPALTNFSINHGITVTGLSAVNGAAIQLATTAFSPTQTYTLTVNGVADLGGLPLAPNSQIAIDTFLEVPLDFGQSVNGFQDDFSQDTTLNANWTVVGSDAFELTNGVLNITTVAGDPNHLLYEAPGYSNDVQEVLLRIRLNVLLNDFVYPRVGAAVGANPTASPVGAGNNLLFVNGAATGAPGLCAEFLNDAVAWGPTVPNFTAQLGTWYWFRLSQTSTNIAGGDNLFAKAWLADGTEPEPADWQVSWAEAGRAGFAGLTGPSDNGPTDADVSYILIKAAGLPSITVTYSALAFVGPRLTPTLTGARSGNNIVLTWSGVGVLQQASAITGPWTDLAGATSPQSMPATGPTMFYRLRQ